MLDRVPKPLKAIVLLVAIGAIAYLIYYEVWYFKHGPQAARDATKSRYEMNRSTQVIEPLIEKGEQQIGEWKVQATHVSRMEFKDATLLKKSDGKVVQEIEAPSMIVLHAGTGDPEGTVPTDVQVQLLKAAVTTYDDEGNAATEQQSQLDIWLAKTSRPGG